MSTEQWGLIVGGLSALIAAGALYFAWRSSRSGQQSVVTAERALATSEEQLRLAREQAELRPKLTLSLGDPPLKYEGVPILGPGEVDAWLDLWITNTGKAVAHNVTMQLTFDMDRLEPVWYREFFVARLAPSEIPIYQHQVTVRVHSLGQTKVRYSFASDEVFEAEDTLEFEVADRRV